MSFKLRNELTYKSIIYGFSFIDLQKKSVKIPVSRTAEILTVSSVS